MPEYKIEVSVKDNDVIEIKVVGGQTGTTLSPGDIKKYKKSPFGLRVIESVSYTQQDEPLTEQTLEPLITNCYMIIGGFKVKVPC